MAEIEVTPEMLGAMEHAWSFSAINPPWNFHTAMMAAYRAAAALDKSRLQPLGSVEELARFLVEQKAFAWPCSAEDLARMIISKYGQAQVTVDWEGLAKTLYNAFYVDETAWDRKSNAVAKKCGDRLADAAIAYLKANPVDVEQIRREAYDRGLQAGQTIKRDADRVARYAGAEFVPKAQPNDPRLVRLVEGARLYFKCITAGKMGVTEEEMNSLESILQSLSSLADWSPTDVAPQQGLGELEHEAARISAKLADQNLQVQNFIVGVGTDGRCAWFTGDQAIPETMTTRSATPGEAAIMREILRQSDSGIDPDVALGDDVIALMARDCAVHSDFEGTQGHIAELEREFLDAVYDVHSARAAKTIDLGAKVLRRDRAWNSLIAARSPKKSELEVAREAMEAAEKQINENWEIPKPAHKKMLEAWADARAEVLRLEGNGG